MNHYFSAIQAQVAAGRPCVLVTVAHSAGSAPREPGARMLVTATQVTGTIGGGNLEFAALRIARARLDDAAAAGAPRFLELFPLGPMLQQCCGGAVFLHFEVLTAPRDWLQAAAQFERDNTRAILVSRTTGTEPQPAEKLIVTAAGARGSLGDKVLDELATDQAQALLGAAKDPKTARQTALLHSLVETKSTLPDTTDALFFEVLAPRGFQVVLFGAGHVGTALVKVLANVPDCQITWVDSRPEQFPSELPVNVSARLAENPSAVVETLPERAYCLVMTHDHQLDQDLCAALLRRADLAFLGLIGSATKRRRFLQRLRQQGLSAAQLQHLTCPIGIPGITAKAPAAIAIAVAAQLLEIKSAADAGQHG